MSRILSFCLFPSLLFLFGCSDPQPGKVKVVSDIPYSKDFVLQRGEWCGLKLPNQKVIYFSCIKDDKPQLVPYSTTGDRTYYGSFPWAEDQAGDYIKAGESKVIGGLSPTRREYTLFIGEFRLDVIEDHTAHGGLPVEVKITK